MNLLARSVFGWCLPLCLWAQSVPLEPTGLQLRVVQGEGAVHKAGGRALHALVVEVVDGAGRPVEGALVSFRLPTIGPGGLFASGLPSDVSVTGKDGRAEVRGMRWNGVAGPFHVRVTAASGEARAGLLVSQILVSELGEPGRPESRQAGGATGSPTVTAGPRDVALPPFKPRRRWLAPFLIAAGAAAGGVTAAFTISRKASSAPGAAAETGVSVGPPAITIGAPK
jgi:hypothetical protein